MAQLTTMKNLGKEMAKKLQGIGISSAEELIEIGSQEAFIRLKAEYPNICLVHLYTLEGAIQGIEFDRLSEKTKANLKAFSDSLK